MSSIAALEDSITVELPEGNTTVTVEGNVAIITCEAIGYPMPTVEWSKSDGNFSDRVLVSDSVSVPTGNGNITKVSVNLEVANASREDTGVYICFASNSVGSDNRSINLTVQCKSKTMNFESCLILIYVL